MVAYSFKSFFASQIEAGIKRQTVRADRARHVRPGEMIQIYQGMRTRTCRKIIPDCPCVGVDHIVIERQPATIVGIEINGIQLSQEEIEEFARIDGFDPEHLKGVAGLDSGQAAANMARFWDREHPDCATFVGKLIRWDPDRNESGG